jgi:hypothetical protein
VVELARLDSCKLLQETELAVGGQKLLDQHKKLIELRGVQQAEHRELAERKNVCTPSPSPCTHAEGRRKRERERERKRTKREETHPQRENIKNVHLLMLWWCARVQKLEFLKKENETRKLDVDKCRERKEHLEVIRILQARKPWLEFEILRAQVVEMKNVRCVCVCVCVCVFARESAVD